jgi:phosphoribosylanthranilate isomerase
MQAVSDLCSSLEAESGKKDIQKIKSFMRKFKSLEL